MLTGDSTGDARRRIAKMRAPKGHCRGCQRPVPKGRKTWCSDACVEAAILKLNPSVARTRVHQRDKGICAECGFDADKAMRILHRLEYGTGVQQRFGPDYLERRRAIALLVTHWNQPKRPRLALYYQLPHLWEADHIVPVAEGGGACELENYRTLCIPCHRAATKALAGRLAEARRVGKMPLLEVGATVAAVDPVDGESTS